MPGPSLRKQYFDAVSPDGAWRIAYRAEFGLPGFRLRYEELNGDDRRKPWWRLRLGGEDGRARFGDSRTWAEWTPQTPAIAHVHETDAFVWRLTGLGGGLSIGGGGGPWETYCEELTLKVGPWALGLETLSWGRVAADGLFVTWIVGDGPRPVRFAVMDGQALSQGVTFEDDRLVTPAGEVRLGEMLRTISAGDVRRDRAPAVRALSRLVFGAGAIRQEKASRRCEVRLTGLPSRSATAICETVVFEP